MTFERVFDAFPDEAGRDARLSGKFAQARMARRPDLFSKGPEIYEIDVMAATLPAGN